MSLYNQHLKRLQHSTSSSNYRAAVPNDEAMRESIQNFSISSDHRPNLTRPLNYPDSRYARRGGGGGGSGRVFDRNWYSSASLPRRTIYYDLAESFMDHSTNPLSSDLYKVHFKHSPKQWPHGRFKNYTEKLDKVDGNIIDILCTHSFPIAPKRKQTNDHKQTETSAIPSIIFNDPAVQERKKKEAEKQTTFYTNFFGWEKNPHFSSTIQIKKVNTVDNSTTSSTSTVVVSKNNEEPQRESKYF